jgi:hypothetical protein
MNDGRIGGRLDHGEAPGIVEPPDLATKRKVAAVTQVSRPGFQEPNAHEMPCAQPRGNFGRLLNPAADFAAAGQAYSSWPTKTALF